jgi:hypothetical protein
MQNNSYTIAITTTPYLGYAQAFNHIPFILRVEITSTAQAYLRDVQVALRVRALAADLCEPVLVTIAQLGKTHIYEADAFDVSGALRPAFDGNTLNTLLAVDSIQHGTVEVTLTHADQVIGTGVATITVVPARVWAWDIPNNATAANLVAYVMHYHPALEQVITVARGILRKNNLPDSFEGYQADRDGVERQVRAIYDALLQYGIGYINPPASWDAKTIIAQAEGQQAQSIRTPELVLDRKLGTCIDTTVLFAAIFEHIGLNPILFLVPGHAFVGYWRVSRNLPQSVTPLSEAMNYIDTNFIGLIETTAIAFGKTFAESQLAARAKIAEAGILSAESDAVCIDVLQARIAQNISPIPSRVQQATGEVVIIQPPKIIYRTAVVQGAEAKDVHIESELNVPRRIVQWKNQLLDLSLANRLINFRIERAAYVQIPIQKNALHTFEDILNQAPLTLDYYPSDEIYEGMSRILLDRGEVEQQYADITGMLAHAKVLAHVRPDRYLPVMRKIVRTAKNIVDQTGVNQLYLALGSLVWSTDGIARTTRNTERAKQDGAPETAAEANETPKTPESSLKPGEIRSPLLLIPINIKAIRKGNVYSITLDESSPVMPNYSLLEKLSRELKFELPLLRNPEQDEHGIDVQGLLAHIKQRIAEEDRPFRVDETCVIGFFDFGNYRLWRDLGDNWQHYMQNPLIQHMVNNQNKPYTPPTSHAVDAIDLDELASELPIPADSSQIDAIRKALAKQTYVLQGPPGTGKSQTIANLIFAALRRNMSVLFVTEKSTAAQVVYDRLSTIKGDADQGIETMVLDIHDQDSKPDAVKTQLLRALDATIAGDKTGYDVQKRAYDQYIHTLKAYPDRLHKIGNFGYSLYTARDRLLALAQTELLPLPAKFFIERKKADVDRIIEALKRVQDTAANVGNTSRNPWTFIGKTIARTTLTPELYAELRTEVDVIYDLSSKLASADATRRVLQTIRTRTELGVLQMMTNPDAVDLELAKLHAQSVNVSFRKRIYTLIEEQRNHEHGPLALADSAIDIVFSNLFAALDTAKNSFILGRAARVDQAQTAIVTYLLRGNFLHYATPAEFLTAITTQQTTAKRLREEVRTYPNLDLPRGWNPLNADHVAILTAALERIEAQVAYMTQPQTALPAATLQAVMACNVVEKQALGQYCTAVEHFLALTGADQASLDSWRGTQSLIEKISESVSELYIDAAQNSFLLLERWVKFSESVHVLYDYDMGDFARGLLNGSYTYHSAIDMFERSFLTKHIERLLLEANLDQFDGKEHDMVVLRFRDASTQVRTFISGLAAEEMLDQRKDFVAANTGEVTNLRRELQKVRRQLKVRQLLSRHAEVIRMLMPCTIASPNSIAMLLDVSSTPYDIVIFDEASQIRVTSAICGIGRADCAIIVGDSKQMPPTSIAEKSLYDEYEESDESIVMDEESILSECVLAQIPSQTLSWHYRSENEMLIAFSNTAYYDGKLSAFPSPQHKTQDKPAVSFVRVLGQFVRATTNPDTIIGGRPEIQTPDGKKSRKSTKSELLNTNPVEAQAIYEYVVQLMHAPATARQSVGILTFNEKQADLIDSIIKAEGADPMVAQRFGEEYKDPHTRGFIKSLETIQGDEADVILFSVAFSKNEQNKLPLNFGPLTRAGGERRLNVAVTRARKQVVVFCSFDPNELRVEDTSSRGIKDLRDYLVLAKDGPEASSKTNTRKHTVDRHRDQIAQAFRDAGLDVRTDVGLTEFKVDIVIADPTEPSRSMGILLDGPRWRGRATVSDRDIFPIDMLELRMGWQKVTRIWLPMWMRNPQGEVRRILDMYAALTIILDEPEPEPFVVVPITSTDADDDSGAADDEAPTLLKSPTPRRASARPPVVVPAEEEPVMDDISDEEVPVVVPTDTPPIREGDVFAPIQPWQPWEPRSAGDKIVLEQPTTPIHKAKILDVILDILRCEAPIEPKRFTRLVGSAFGYSRMTEQRAADVLAVRIPLVKRDKEGFLYPVGIEPREYVYTRAADPTATYNRSIDEICLPELGNTMVHLVAQSDGMSIDSVCSETVRWFGGARVTEGIKARLMLALKSFVKLGRLAQDGDEIRASG